MIPVSLILDELEIHVAAMEKAAQLGQLQTLHMESDLAWGISLPLCRFDALDGEIASDDQARWDALEARRKAAALA